MAEPLETRLTDERMRQYIDVFNTVFSGMMPSVGYRRASLRIHGTSEYAFTFSGDGRKITEFAKGIDKPQLLVEVKADNLMSLLDRYGTKLERVKEKPEEAIRALSRELSHFTVTVNRSIPDGARFLALVGYVLVTYGFHLQLMTNRPTLKFERLG